MSLPRRIGLGAAILLSCLIAAAWLLPPLWDWNRQRETMEAFAAAALGRPVHIAGGIKLTLLPEPMLVADQVQLPGAGSAGELRIRSLRLGVGLAALLGGRIVARHLVLQGPELTLPWPPAPADIAAPAWYAGLDGRIEEGRISIGAVRLSDITADISVAEDGVLSLAGQLTMAGAAWRVSGRLGQAGPVGGGIELTLSGQASAAGTRIGFTGEMRGEAGIGGRLSMQGPDLSAWLPVPPTRFRAEGALRAGPAGWAWRDIGLDLAGMPARAEVEIAGGQVPTIQARLQVPRLSLDGWPPLRGHMRDPPVPIRLTLDTEAAALAGGNLRQVHAELSLGDGEPRLSAFSAILPGDAALRLDGRLAPGYIFEGHIGVDAPDPRASIGWLAAATGVSVPALPAGTLWHVAFDADLALDAVHLSLRNLAGRVDDTTWQGQLGIEAGQKLTIKADLATEHLALDAVRAEHLPSWGELAPHLAGMTVDARVRARSVRLAGRGLEDVLLDAQLGPDRLELRRLEAASDGARIVASGAIGADRRLAHGMLEISADTASAVAGWLPSRWRGDAMLWDGRLALRAEAAGPAEALGVQLGVDLGDARVEAQAVANLGAASLAGRLSLRHPNAIRLLAAFGWPIGDPASPHWPGEGSLSAQAQFFADADRLELEQFDMTAGALRASGRAGLSWPDGEVQIGGRLLAETLPLPWPGTAPDDPLPAWLLRGWSAQVLVQAGEVLRDQDKVASDLVCLLSQARQAIRLSGCTARLADGEARIDAELDLAAQPPVLVAAVDLAGARIEAVSPWLQWEGEPVIEFRAAQADLRLTARGTGHSIAALRDTLRGEVTVAAREGLWSGFDLARAGTVLAEGLGRPVAASAEQLRDSLSHGETPCGSLALRAAISGARLDVREGQCNGGPGSIGLSGQVGLDGHETDLRFTLQPAPIMPGTVAAPVLQLRLSVPARAPRRLIDIDAALRWLAAR